MREWERAAGVWRCDIHLHSGDDPRDQLHYSTDALFARAAHRGLDVVSLTLHNTWSYTPELAARAAAQGLLLVPGIEKDIEGRHVLIYNADADVEQVETFDELRAYKRPEMLVMAPHPFYPARTCLREKLLAHLDLFDAIEFCWFYHPRLNWNRMAQRVAVERGLPLVGTSDSHTLDRVGRYFTTIRAPRTVAGILDGIRAGLVRPYGAPLSLPRMGMSTMVKAAKYAGRAAWEWATPGGTPHATAA